jgi:hypothetical protein
MLIKTIQYASTEKDWSKRNLNSPRDIQQANAAWIGEAKKKKKFQKE